jgi:uncharacterized protein
MRQPPSIDAYGDGGFRVQGKRHEGSLLLLDDQPHVWPVRSLAELKPEDFAEVVAAGPGVSEFILLGTGAVMAPPSRAVKDAMRAAGLGLEFMSTEAAAKLYNVLATQGRRVAVALIAI